ncbi:MAG: monofunctional biosynthetic peptidoglycan transglycosylase [Burkholderiaceae bacterium]|jgi:monofunctional biosynthetic peptidoglycan transglycosylase|nr:monofunctional biosynthetic peptidoglycan transglycosylase [Polynucleobacter sp.]MCF8187459.1 monofunctional biosynthetic peptidoglycan transglycosylase [Sulfuritalea sp.]
MKLRRTIMLWLVALPLALLLLIQAWYLLHIYWWVNHNPTSTAFMRTQLEKLQEKNPKAKLQHTWVPYNRISVHLKRAIIAAEDANFAEHDGVDWEALQKAYEKNAKKGKVVSGGSTITQQLAKNLFLSGQRSYLRKAEEMAITFMLEMVMDKRRIFEIYLNVIELGSGVFGAEAGAQRYFGVSAAALGPSEAARLAVMLPNPRYFGKHMDSNYLARRSALIQQRMNSSDLP